jgi:PilZ domain
MSAQAHKVTVEQRQFERLAAEVPVSVRARGVELVCTSRNVSRRGLFLSADHPPPQRQLLILRIAVPDGLPPADVMGSVVRAITPEDAARTGMEAGIGVDFFALNAEVRERWDCYLLALKGEAHGAPAPIGPATKDGRPTFLLRLPTYEQLRDFYQSEVMRGAMFLRTPVLRTIGEEVDLVLLHPRTGAEFPLLGTIRGLSMGLPGAPRGMNLDLAPLDPDSHRAFQAYLEAQLPVAPHEVGAPADASPSTGPSLVNPFAGASPAPVLAATAVDPADPNRGLRQVLASHPDDFDSRLRLGCKLAHEAATAAEAVTLLRAVLEEEPQHPLAHSSIALALALLGESEKATQHKTRARKLGHVLAPEAERRLSDLIRLGRVEVTVEWNTAVET